VRRVALASTAGFALFLVAFGFRRGHSARKGRPASERPRWAGQVASPGSRAERSRGDGTTGAPGLAAFAGSVVARAARGPRYAPIDPRAAAPYLGSRH